MSDSTTNTAATTGVATGAGEKVVDVSVELARTLETQPAVEGLLRELGFEDLPGDRSILQICEDAGVDPSIVTLALAAEGFETRGYASGDGGVAAKTFENVLSALFDPTSTLMPDGSSSQAPMFSHMEAAIRRAQDRGDLPKE
ncbi:hypothetical protein [Parafannyhessea umbonata]|uniref:Uncharacterized protein n=1 Tax=Parafannyhessea umbonata TaxID=604330 RepID=A0A1H1LT94_9ACTN|nr:hypothetical protein [Parafannyhessea umbonata]SDR77562.1 hypothetical protein SAMN04489857_1118 [Parafannyhessea umbonata]